MRRVQGSGLRIEALGVAGSPAPDRLTTCFRLTGGIVLDTGAAAHSIPPERRDEIETVLLSHSHLDHTLGLPFLLGKHPVRVLGPAESLAAVRGSLLDGRIWPDLSAHALWSPIAAGDSFECGPWHVEVGATSHTIPCLSFLFRGGAGAVAVVGDTRLDADVVDWVASRKPVRCIVEASYPDANAEIARRYGHQTPADLRTWREALGADCALCVTHMKPAYEAAVRAECEALGDSNLHILQDGDVLPL